MAEWKDITMVIVDTTVWIDFFNAKPSREVQVLERFLVERNDLCICGVILTEVLQGILSHLNFSSL